MKIIAVDNFDRETHSDVLIAENVTECCAPIIAAALNEKLCKHDDSPTFYRAVPDDYKLYRYEP
jgi:hypothetical protein